MLSQIGLQSKIGNFNFKLNLSFGEFKKIQAKYTYAAFSTVLEIIIYTISLVQVTPERYQLGLRHVLKVLKGAQSLILTGTVQMALYFEIVYQNNVINVVCIDIGSSLNERRSSRIRVWVMMTHELKGTINVIHFVNCRSKRVCTFLLETELLLLVNEFDNRYSISHILTEIMGRNIDLFICRDGRFLYRLCIFLSHSTERRLQIEIFLRERPHTPRYIQFHLRISKR